MCIYTHIYIYICIYIYIYACIYIHIFLHTTLEFNVHRGRSACKRITSTINSHRCSPGHIESKKLDCPATATTHPRITRSSKHQPSSQHHLPRLHRPTRIAAFGPRWDVQDVPLPTDLHRQVSPEQLAVIVIIRSLSVVHGFSVPSNPLHVSFPNERLDDFTNLDCGSSATLSPE